MREIAAGRGRPGRLIALGGLADRTRQRDLLRLFHEAAGGPGSRLVVLDAEPADPRNLSLSASATISGMGAESLVAAFRDFGPGSVEVLRLGARARLDLLESATGLFLAGSGPSWLPLPDGPWSEALRRRSGKGLVVGGSGAGAAVFAERCIAPASGAGGGSAGGGRRVSGLVPGLGLLPGLLLDPQLRQRDRLGRLLGGLAVDPMLLALGIDEDTAVIFDSAEETFEVRGSGAVLVINALESASFPSPPRTADPRPMLGLRVDLLTAGCRYDLRERQSHPGTVHGTGSRRLPVPGRPQGE